jgi:hypothetical protein
MSTTFNPYSGYHDFVWTPRPCGAPSECHNAPATDRIGPAETYWMCPACCANAALATVASTLSHYDDARAGQAARFRLQMSSMAIPGHTQLIMQRFVELGGKVASRRAIELR